MQLQETLDYARWFEQVADPRARARILVRLRRLSLGNPGDVSPVGAGVSELRIHFGPGYRVYFKSQGSDRVVLLWGWTQTHPGA